MHFTQRKFMRATLAASLFLIATATTAQDSWKVTEMAAAKAAKQAHFAETERLLTTNLKVAEKLSPKDTRLPRTLLDLAEIFRAAGKYSEAFTDYERALQAYTARYGTEATDAADTI